MLESVSGAAGGPWEDPGRRTNRSLPQSPNQCAHGHNRGAVEAADIEDVGADPHDMLNRLDVGMTPRTASPPVLPARARIGLRDQSPMQLGTAVRAIQTARPIGLRIRHHRRGSTGGRFATRRSIAHHTIHSRCWIRSSGSPVKATILRCIRLSRLRVAFSRRLARRQWDPQTNDVQPLRSIVSTALHRGQPRMSQ